MHVFLIVSSPDVAVERYAAPNLQEKLKAVYCILSLCLALVKNPKLHKARAKNDPKVFFINTYYLTFEPCLDDGQMSQGTKLQGVSNSIFRKNNCKL